jgi:catechol 2,3-dioxygenase
MEYFHHLLGLVELGREDGRVYLGAGLDENVDLVIEEGGTGVTRIGLRVDADEDLDRYAGRLREAGVEHERGAGRLPGQGDALRFAAPGGTEFEFVLVDDRRYLEPYRPAHARNGGVGLLDVDHVTVSHTDPQAYAEFFRDVLGFRFSDTIELENGPWIAAWMRMGTYHHDLAVMAAAGPEESLHHLAWTCESIDHLKACLDRLSDAGIRLEAGIGRHPAGSNLFAYYMDPSGNRTELSAEMANLDPATPNRVWGKPDDTFDAWAIHDLPDSFRRGT